MSILTANYPGIPPLFAYYPRVPYFCFPTLEYPPYTDVTCVGGVLQGKKLEIGYFWVIKKGEGGLSGNLLMIRVSI